MGKSTGLIGNFRGKVGNMVGYNLKDSNNKQTQGIRIYQPIVKNPKTWAQAEQRAKLAPINATYRALKVIIDRGYEGISYGNKSRRAWLKIALAANIGAWIEKGATVSYPWLCQISRGTLPALPYPEEVSSGYLEIALTGLTAAVDNTGALSSAFRRNFDFIKNGDQITFIALRKERESFATIMASFVIDPSTELDLPDGLTCAENKLTFGPGVAGCAIISRLGDNGEHLRSTATLRALTDDMQGAISDEKKEAAIRSYMGSSLTTDWPEDKFD